MALSACRTIRLRRFLNILARLLLTPGAHCGQQRDLEAGGQAANPRLWGAASGSPCTFNNTLAQLVLPIAILEHLVSEHMHALSFVYNPA